ncbi:MAG TPA: Stp1/IreP family PP2C-type Ser/Thr phosphatase, partial [Alphaproteobacteria bacterium]|nr:Stp1/IreP family PP2C-type Ser/Thr phosphatase [Alphaproteobacteria bacterium]
MKLRFRGRTDVGKTRDHNEDDYGYGEGAQVERLGELLVVCDGMGGHAAGEVASHMGVETIIAAYYDDPTDDRPHALKQAFEEANARIHAEGRGSMGTTGVAALVYHDALHVANVGDSRGYLIRGGELRQVTRDHSLVSEQVAAGVITAEQARSLYYRNVITRALGYQPEVAVDLFRMPLQPGDVVVLCSDGLHGLVTDEEIRQIASSEPLEAAVDHLVDLANERGGSDNITVLIAHVDALEWAVNGADDDTADSVTVELPAEEIAAGAAAEGGGPHGTATLAAAPAPDEPLVAAAAPDEPAAHA